MLHSDDHRCLASSSRCCSDRTGEYTKEKPTHARVQGTQLSPVSDCTRGEAQERERERVNVDVDVQGRAGRRKAQRRGSHCRKSPSRIAHRTPSVLVASNVHREQSRRG